MAILRLPSPNLLKQRASSPPRKQPCKLVQRTAIAKQRDWPPEAGQRARYTVLAVAGSQGASGSFEELAMPLFAQLYNFACWLTGDRIVAEDIVQECFMKALRGFSSYQQGTNFRAWMYRILHNTYLTSQTGLKTAVSLDDDAHATPEPATCETPESILLIRYEQRAIEEALGALPVHYREAILLCDVEEMSYQEISQTLGVPMGTVMSRLSRARKAMRSLLSANARGAQP
jgi:RNA polymerase sigma-70 factor, ECF subfamily